MKKLLKAVWVLGALALMTACGQPGSPQAPSLEMPKAVDNLSATRKGNTVTLRWLPPNRFTDNRLIKKVGPTNICRVPGSAPVATCTSVAKVAAKGENTSGKPGERTPVEYDDELPQSVLQSAPNGSVMYGVEVLNIHGRSVGVSNQVQISTAPAVAPAESLTASLEAQGVTLRWSAMQAPNVEGLSFRCQVSRRVEGGDWVVLATVPLAPESYLDANIEWEKNLEYRIAVLTERASDRQVLVEGNDSHIAKIFTHDVFPPATPREVQAVFSGPGQQPFIDLSWAPNTESDLAGYNVYRREEGGTLEKINAQLVTSPSFRDEHVVSGKSYEYAVSAVDARGNESGKSAEARESVP